MKQCRGPIVLVHDLVQLKCCVQHFTSQRPFLQSLLLFQLLWKPSWMADKVVLSSSKEFQACLVDANIQEHLKFWMLKIFGVQFFRLPARISGTKQYYLSPHFCHIYHLHVGMSIFWSQYPCDCSRASNTTFSQYENVMRWSIIKIQRGQF